MEIGRYRNTTCICHTEEAFTDLEQASTFMRINLEIKWSEMEDDEFVPSSASTWQGPG